MRSFIKEGYILSPAWQEGEGERLTALIFTRAEAEQEAVRWIRL